MKKRILVLAAALFLGPLASISSAGQSGTAPASVSFELTLGSQLAVELALCGGSDDGGPKLDQIMLDDVGSGGGSGKVHWIFELYDTGDGSEYLMRPVQGCADGGEIHTPCGAWELRASVDIPSGPTGLIVLTEDPGSAGGMARGEVEIPLTLEFTRVGDGTVKHVDHDFIYYIRAPWATVPGPDAWESSTPFPIDVDCDGNPDEQAPPTTGAPALGWVEDPISGIPVRGQLCGAGEEVGGWLCVSPALVPPTDDGDSGDLGHSGDGGMS